MSSPWHLSERELVIFFLSIAIAHILDVIIGEAMEHIALCELLDARQAVLAQVLAPPCRTILVEVLLRAPSLMQRRCVFATACQTVCLRGSIGAQLQQFGEACWVPDASTDPSVWERRVRGIVLL